VVRAAARGAAQRRGVPRAGVQGRQVRRLRYVVTLLRAVTCFLKLDTVMFRNEAHQSWCTSREGDRQVLSLFVSHAMYA
jgi:hypothetical protein